ncbi:hypothetical protein, partial [uncultured Algibacter sp.]|uniref:hypothetical protein n=1 Tax=uncultured Algibacter sp. TaxID=298659 RepID=UPI0030EF6AE6
LIIIIVVRLKIVRLKKTFANPKFSGLIKKRGLLFAITEKFYFLESYEFKNYCLSISYNQVFVPCLPAGRLVLTAKRS